MKRLVRILTSVLALFLYGCSVDIDGINDRLEALEARVQALEELCAQINTNVSSLQAIVDASQTGDYITSVVPVTEGDKTVGYTISFVKGAPITIYHGKDGEDGKDGENGVDGSDGTDGYTPKISAAKDEDGVYYWTLDGEWLLDASGQKIPVQGSNGADGEDGADGVTPQFKIEEGIWYVSYDGGAGWIQLSEAVSDDGDIVYDSIFEEVRDEEGSVTFVLHDGGTIVIPKMSEFNLLFEEPSEIKCEAGEVVRVAYRVVGGDGDITVECFDNNGYSAVIEPADYSHGYVAVSVPSPVVSGKVLVYAYDATGRTVMRTLVFEEGVLVEIPQTYEIGGEAQWFEVNITTNLDYTVTVTAETYDWISVDPVTKSDIRTDILRISVTEYPDGPDREATISLIYRDKIVQSIRVIQSSIANTPIQFADELVKYVLLGDPAVNLDGDNEITLYEAAQCEQLPSFEGSDIKSFNELQYFTKITSIDNSMFAFSQYLSEITLPSSLVRIGDNAFMGCYNMTRLYIPEGVTSIGEAAFHSCTILSDVQLPESLESLGNIVFGECKSITEIEIPSGVKSIGTDLFFSCESLESVILPAGIASISEGMFVQCLGLKTINIPSSVTSIEARAFNGSGITEIDIPSGVTAIGAEAFYNCKSLSKINLPSSITSIGERAFFGCFTLLEITIPANVISIGESAFVECQSMKEMVFLSPEPPVIAGDFWIQTDSLERILVPKGSKAAYESVLGEYLVGYVHEME